MLARSFSIFAASLAVASLDGAPLVRVALSGASGFQSIQKAVDSAPPGARIEIAEGVFRENLTIDKAVTLVGAGIGRTIVELPGDTEPTMEAHWNKLLERFDSMTMEEIGAEFKQRRDRASEDPFQIRGKHRVRIEGVEFVWAGPKSVNPAAIEHLLDISEADVVVRESAFIGSPANGVRIRADANCDMEACLIAGNWNVGVTVGAKASPVRKVRIADCDIRNNQRSHIVIYYDACEVRIERNLLHGSAWFGIRTGGTNTVISGNAIYDNARTGFYAVGSAVTAANNLFFNNQFGGISCWGGNRDLIVGNTFVNNGTSGVYGGYGVSCIGDARPTIRDNIFVEHGYAIQSTFSGGMKRETAPIGQPEIGRNLYWKNGTNIVSVAPVRNQDKGVIVTAVSTSPESMAEYDPEVWIGRKREFALPADSRARREGLGALDLPPLLSPHPLRDREKAILPEGEDWGFQAWKKPPGPDSRDFEKRLMTLFAEKQLAAKRPQVSYLEAFKDLHTTLGRQYQSFKLKGIDWAEVGKKLIPRAEKVKDEREFGLLVYELVARLEDSHATVSKGLVDPPAVEFPQWDPGLACLLDDRGKPVVYHVDPGKSAERAGVKIGMTIVSVNGRPAAEVIEETMAQAKRYSGYSSERYLSYHATQWFLRQMEKGTRVKIVAEDLAGARRSLDLSATEGVRYLPRRPVALEGIRDSANVDWTMLENGMGLIYVRRIRNDLIAQLDKAVAELKGVRGLIIDVRGNSGGGFEFDRAHRNFVADKTEEPERPRFTGPMALLIDSRCISAGEGWASWFIANQRARVFGTATAGASARKTTYELKNKLFKVTFPVKPYKGYLDRIIEHRGLEPDVAIRQTAKDLAAGRDTVLEAAAAWLDKQIPAAR